MTATETTIDLPRLQQLLEQLGRIIEPAQGAAGVVKAVPSLQVVDKANIADPEPTLALAKEIYSFRRKRTEFFNSDLFADPGWDILLELYRLRLEGRRSSVKCICIASEVPPTTALRWINILIAQGLVNRTNDSSDHRVRWISLSDAGYQSMRELLQSALDLKGTREELPARRAWGGAR